MIIDLSEWNEYVADDVPPGPIPEGVKVEFMQITETVGIKDIKNGCFPTGILPEISSMKVRFFWRIKE